MTPWIVACQAPLSVEFFRKEYWNGLPFPFAGDLLDPRIKPGSLTLQVGCLLSELPGKPSLYILIICDSLYILIYMVVYIHIYVYVYPSIYIYINIYINVYVCVIIRNTNFELCLLFREPRKST